MIKHRFIRNLSANTIQLVTNQVFGLLIFYCLSKGLNKEVFGQLNWCLAILLAGFGMLSFGMDQVMVKKIAAGYNRSSVFNAYLFHVMVSGCIFYGLLALLSILFSKTLASPVILLLIAFGKLGVYISMPYKQLAIGVEKFRVLLAMSVTSNIVRGTSLLVILLAHAFSIQSVLVIFLTGDVLELVLCMLLAKRLLTEGAFKTSKRIYWLLLKESLPQTGVVVCTAIMSRFDWILVGILRSSTQLAEYSFAWKAFEVATFPLLVIAPMMLPLFTRISRTSAPVSVLFFFLEWQLMIASLVALLLNMTWAPLVDAITDGKYGAVNGQTIFFLSLSMPLLYCCNYLWTIEFAKGRLKKILMVMLGSCAINMFSCSLLIPMYGNKGAAIAYLLTLTIQLLFYLRQARTLIPVQKWLSLLLWPLLALITGLSVKSLQYSPLAGMLLSAIAYIGVVFISKKIRLEDWKRLHVLYR